jgi:hypothetical protein
VARFGPVDDIQGVVSGSKSAGKCIGYLTKYLTKATGECHQPETDAQRAHLERLADALRIKPCSERCANWLLYGIQPAHARAGLVAGRCKGKAHRPETLGFAGRRILVSRKWSGKTLTDHRDDRSAYVLRVLGGVTTPDNQHDRAENDVGRYAWERARPDDPDTPSRAQLLMRALTQRRTWQQQYRAAQARADLSATTPTAA